MKGLFITLGVIVLLIVLLGGCGISNYNAMNAASKDVDQKWGNVQSSYQRRSDLIPNLVSTVKAAANFETKTLTDVIEARASATQIKIDPKDLISGPAQPGVGPLNGCFRAVPAIKGYREFQIFARSIGGYRKQDKGVAR